ncbi:MAG: energy transducer TonB, partial [Blastocatellia bacterium]
YTELARQHKIQGSVILSVIYGADGLIHDIRVQHGLPDGLTEEAIAAARQIRFNPATREGKPVSVRGNIEYNFTLY